LQHAVRRVLDQEPRAQVDYVEIVDAETFQPVAYVSRPAYVLVAAKFGQTRLLDNLLIAFTRMAQKRPLSWNYNLPASPDQPLIQRHGRIRPDEEFAAARRTVRRFFLKSARQL